MDLPKPNACKTLDEINVGDLAELTFTLTDDDIHTFGKVSGDYNPLHFCDDYANTTIFKGRIGHGTILQGKVSQLLGVDLPGLGALWGRQQASFLGPIRIGQTYKVWVEISDKQNKFATYTCGAEDAEGNTIMKGDGDIYPIPAKVKAKMVEDGSLEKLLA
ncbi:MAG: MaoC family dehydratase [Alphaproteobacteria bacterium]|nr:MaoC family dehydratase [Alphaproteobacteria bacterium]MDD9919274.1 MaoC family dehydratase [Alphaproteobacteria bacterium]